MDLLQAGLTLISDRCHLNIPSLPVMASIIILLHGPPVSSSASPTRQGTFHGSRDLSHPHIRGDNVYLVFSSSAICQLHEYVYE